MDIIYLLAGILILLIGIYDFLFTTLSSSGAGPLARWIFFMGHKITRTFVSTFGRSFFRFSAVIVNLLTLLIWLLLCWLGLFLLYSYYPEGITDAQGRAANFWERLYFTGYTLSTLGMGEFRPGTTAYQILTSCFSFYGFIFFTSSMTYFLSLFSAISNQRVLAKLIYGLGHNPVQIADTLKKLDSSYLSGQLLSFAEKVNQHIINHQAYPVIHYISHPGQEVTLSLNIARLDEALNIVITEKDGSIAKRFEPLKEAISAYVIKMQQNFIGNNSRTVPLPSSLLSAVQLNINAQELEQRRKVLGHLIEAEGFTWQDVVQSN